jgi:hypothetical protein
MSAVVPDRRVACNADCQAKGRQEESFRYSALARSYASSYQFGLAGTSIAAGHRMSLSGRQ